VENDTGSWRLFTELAVQPNPHYPTLKIIQEAGDYLGS